jgi:hypothetical protein
MEDDKEDPSVLSEISKNKGLRDNLSAEALLELEYIEKLYDYAVYRSGRSVWPIKSNDALKLS